MMDFLAATTTARRAARRAPRAAACALRAVPCALHQRGAAREHRPERKDPFSREPPRGHRERDRHAMLDGCFCQEELEIINPQNDGENGLANSNTDGFQ